MHLSYFIIKIVMSCYASFIIINNFMIYSNYRISKHILTLSFFFSIPKQIRFLFSSLWYTILSSKTYNFIKIFGFTTVFDFALLCNIILNCLVDYILNLSKHVSKQIHQNLLRLIRNFDKSFTHAS